MPLVTVIMPVYNAASYLEEAVNSILNQTFVDFEFLIFNDGSTDSSSSVLNNIYDSRIVLYDYKDNTGYVKHLNKGLEVAKGKYIARMDSDDIALPTRFAQQVALLEEEPEVGLCGTAYNNFGARSYTVKVPLNDSEAKRYLLRDSPFGHPTVMFRKSIIEQYSFCYDKDYMPAEDYKLWYDFSKVSKIKNLPDVLLHYRVHLHQISSYMNETQRNNADKVRVLQLLDKGFILNAKEQQLYCQILQCTACPQTDTEFSELIDLMWKISNQNKQLLAYDTTWFEQFFIDSWRNAVNGVQQFKLELMHPMLLKGKPLPDPFGISDKLKLFVKNLIHWHVKDAALI
jgi:glycosyltransferase involved in cell wall biosynthesis